MAVPEYDLGSHRDISARQVEVPSSDITAVLIEMEFRKILVASVYVPARGNVEDTALSRRLEHLRRVVQDTRRQCAPQAAEVFLAGDFNRHDQLWGGDAVGPKPAQGEGMPIIDFMVDHQLESLLPRGTITYEGSLERRTTIDLVLASTSLANDRVRCDIYPEEHGSDHRAIETHFDLDPPRQDFSPRLLFEQAR
jgi:endonuclease/exonuclease/phosphatase family metal-dependent hydrolase